MEPGGYSSAPWCTLGSRRCPREREAPVLLKARRFPDFVFETISLANIVDLVRRLR